MTIISKEFGNHVVAEINSENFPKNFLEKNVFERDPLIEELL